MLPNVNKQNLGFTLIELLIALFIFTIVSMIMFSALHTIFNNQNSTERNSERFAQLQIALTLMARDFEQAINRPVTHVSGALENFNGSNTSATFTHAGLANPLGQIQRSTLQHTRYQLVNDTLTRETWDALDQTTQTQLHSRKLLTGVTDLRFEYYDKDKNLQNRWPPANQPGIGELPVAVRVYISLKDLGKISQLYILPGQKF